MKEIYNAAWYAAQEVAPWPFLYTPISDKGDLLPDSIISDVKLLMRGNDTVHITGVQVTDAFVSVVISSGSGIIAACTVQQPVRPYRHYKLETFVDNVVGVIVFGHGACTEFGSWQFSENNTLNPAAIVTLPGFPVLSIGKSSKLSGDITLESGSDLILEKVDVELGNTVADGNVVNNDTIPGTGYKLSLSVNSPLRSTTVTTQQELLKEYAGPCSMRLSNNDCPYIISINGVTPDINGNINIKTADNDFDLQTITVVEKGSYLYIEEETCKDAPNESVFVLIGDKVEIDNAYHAGTFRRCGDDYCEITDDDNNQSDFQNVTIVNDGKTNGIRINQTTGLIEPMDGIKGRAAIRFVDTPHSQVEAIFPYNYYISAGAPVFSIIYNIVNEDGLDTYKEFRFDRNTLTLGTASTHISVAYGARVRLELSYASGVFTGTLSVLDRGEISQTTSLNYRDTNTGGMGVYIEHCRCQSWRAT